MTLHQPLPRRHVPRQDCPPQPLTRQPPPLGSAQRRPCGSAGLGRPDRGQHRVVAPIHGAILKMFDKIVNNLWRLTAAC